MNAAAVGIAVIGPGNWATVLTKALVKSRKLALRTCFSRQDARRRNFAEKFACSQDDSFEAVLARDDVEAVLIATPDNTHAEYAIQAAQAGRHVIVEKPMANNVVACRAMIEACAKAGVTLATAHGHRHSQAMQYIKRMIESGKLGAPVMAIGKFSVSEGQALTAERWRYFRAACPAGPMQPLGVHIVDNFNFLFGAPRRVMATFKKQSGSAEIDDLAQVMIEYAGNVVATVVTSFISPRTYGLHVYGTEANALFTSTTSGAGFDRTTTLLVQEEQDAAGTPVDLADGNILLSELDNFADAIRQKRAPACDGEQGLQAVAVLEAAMRSNEQGAWVKIDDL